ncbi:hypothetical protein NITLEN_10157 [Nitrospira lenta]|uniref:Uncharacterized protein n=1 Tax=Nitrospira lenta TaxID=1436998 RepID=A0A330KZW8_9BACT|nr:hypothetical protein NITLEN_10157 [Nitrospira lenta]
MYNNVHVSSLHRDNFMHLIL